MMHPGSQFHRQGNWVRSCLVNILWYWRQGKSPSSQFQCNQEHGSWDSLLLSSQQPNTAGLQGTRQLCSTGHCCDETADLPKQLCKAEFLLHIVKSIPCLARLMLRSLLCIPA